MSDMWSTIAAERGALAADLTAVSEEQWRTPSLCTQWSVREALAHMTATAQTTPGSFAGGFLASGFSFNRFVNKGIAKNLGADGAATLENFRTIQSSTKSPPGPKTSWLGETLVHAEDIRRPLAIQHDYPLDALREVADFYKGSNALIGTKKRIEGLTLRATDTAWSHGSGPLVEGPMLSLLLAMTGRMVACDDLTGPGVQTLAARRSTH